MKHRYLASLLLLAAATQLTANAESFTMKTSLPMGSSLKINVDRGLNEDAYICPGLGDAGDRIFGTK